MSRNTIELILKGTDAGVSGLLDKVSGGLGGLGAAAATALGVLGGSLISGAIQKIGELGRAIGDTLLNEAPALDQVRRSFENLAASAGASSSEVLASMREAANGMVSDADLMTSYNEAMLLVGESMATKFPALLQIAQASAAATGQNVGFMLDSLVKGIGRASPMILDNLGLTINAAEAYQTHADSLGISVDAMSKAQQQQALLNAVTEQGGEFIARLGDNTGGTAATLGQLKTSMTNLKDGIAAALLPALGALLTPLAALAEEYGPAIIAWAGEAGVWLATNLPVAIATLLAVWEQVWPVLQGAIEAVWPVVQEILAQIAAWMENDGPAALGSLQAVWGEVWAFIQELTGQVVGWIQANLPLIIAAGQSVADFWTNHLAPATDNAWTIIKTVISTILNVIMGVIRVVMQVITGDWEGAWETIKTIAATVWKAIETIITQFMEGVLNSIGSSLEEFKATWSSNWEMAKTIVTTIWDNIVSTIGERLASARAKVEEILGQIKSFISGFSLRDVGAALIDGLADGIRNAAGRAIEAARGVVRDAISAAKALLGISSPSRVFAEMGKNMSLGMAQGISALDYAPGQAVRKMVGELTMAGDQSDRSVTIYGGLHVNEARDGRGVIAQVQALAV